MTASLYAFLVVALLFFLREMHQTIRQKENQRLPNIYLHTDAVPVRTFSQTEIFIGRDPQNDLQLNDETISARHARIYLSNNLWMVEDSLSTNGTFLNNEKILTPAALVEDDIIRCGKINIRISFNK
jgi:pSer/pThr/pTyr-binding forkhead associated (FHA) protein